LTFGPIGKNDGHLDDIKSTFPGRELHLNLESITGEADVVEIQGFQHPAGIALKPAVVSLTLIPVIIRT
jgi:hypothetical protein